MAEQPTQQFPPFQPPPPPKSHRTRRIVLTTVGLAAALGIGAAIGSAGSSTTVKTVAGPAVVKWMPGPTKTVIKNVPGPVRTVIKSVPAAPSSAAQPPPAPAAPAAPPTTAAPAAPAQGITASQQQAVTAAQQYLDLGSGFSRLGLIQQLTSSYGNGFSQADATFAVDYLHPDWNAQAVEAAKGYMALGGFSRASLIQQLTSSYGSQFTEAQAEYAATAVGL